jgi:hypothetical protein
MIQCLEKIHVSFVCISLPEVKRAAAYIKELSKPISGRGKPCIYHLVDSPNGPVKNQVYNMASELSWMQVEIAEFIANLPEPAKLAKFSAFNITIRRPS